VDATKPLDTRKRPMHDLRISVTDRCNFRCPYCMPRDVFGPEHPFLDRAEILSFEEIERVARVFARLGVVKLRLTGGEPLVRRGIEDLVRRLVRVPGVEDLALTTNGALLAAKARALADAGLRRITVSVDSVDDAVFRRMNDVDFPLERVLRGIDAAAAAGISPIKVNAVVKRGVNDEGVVDLARHFREKGHVLRFIEYMDVGASNGWRLADVLPSAEVRRRIHAAFPLEPVPPAYPGEVATRWRYADGRGEIGFVSSVTEPFCGDCSRARLSADGRLFTCLFATAGTDLKGPLRSGATDADLEAIVRRVWLARADRYSELRSAATPDLPKVEMSFIGG
jgi:cyclic pyranopterin phosphate synthase